MGICDLLGFPLLPLSALGLGLLLALPVFAFAEESAPSWPVRIYFAFLRVGGYSFIKRELKARTSFPLSQQFLVSWFLFFFFALLTGIATSVFGGTRWQC